MLKTTYEIDVNIKRPTTHKITSLVIGDTANTILLRVFDNDEPFNLEDCEVVAVFRKPNGDVCTQDSRYADQGILVEQDSNEVELSLFSDSFDGGKTLCELEIYQSTNGDGIYDLLLTTANIELHARPRNANENALSSFPRFPRIEELLLEAETANSESSELLEYANNLYALLEEYVATIARAVRTERYDVDGAVVEMDGLDGKGLHIYSYYNEGTPLVEFVGSEGQTVRIGSVSAPVRESDTATKGYVDEVFSNAVSSVNGKTGTVTLYPSDIGYQFVYGDEQLFDVGDALDAYGNDLQKLLNDAVFERVNGRYTAKDDIDMDEYYIRNAFFDVLSIDGDGYIYAVPTDDDSITNKKYVDTAITTAIGNIDTLLGSGVIE